MWARLLSLTVLRGCLASPHHQHCACSLSLSQPMWVPLFPSPCSFSFPSFLSFLLLCGCLWLSVPTGIKQPKKRRRRRTKRTKRRRRRRKKKQKVQPKTARQKAPRTSPLVPRLLPHLAPWKLIPVICNTITPLQHYQHPSGRKQSHMRTCDCTLTPIVFTTISTWSLYWLLENSQTHTHTHTQT